MKSYDLDNDGCFTFRVKTRTAAKYGLSAQPRLVDIIAAVPPQYRKVLVPKLKAKPIRTASGVSGLIHETLVAYLLCQKSLPPANTQLGENEGFGLIKFIYFNMCYSRDLCRML